MKAVSKIKNQDNSESTCVKLQDLIVCVRTKSTNSRKRFESKVDATLDFHKSNVNETTLKKSTSRHQLTSHRQCIELYVECVRGLEDLQYQVAELKFQG